VGHVSFNLSLETSYSANGFYKFLFKLSCIVIGGLLFFVIILAIAYSCETKRYNRLMEEKKEFK
jgi:preprotein translocase subunit SecG